MTLTLNPKRIREREALRRKKRDTNAQVICETLGGTWYGDYGVGFCPAHQDIKSPSLSVRNASDGRLLVKCFAGCSGSEVLNALRARGHPPNS